MNRTASFYTERFDAGGRPYERYLYDAAGYRFARIPVGGTGDGRPVITLRNADGKALSEYRVEPGDSEATMLNDFVYGNGTLWVERTVCEAAPTMNAAGASSQGGSFPFQLTGHEAGTRDALANGVRGPIMRRNVDFALLDPDSPSSFSEPVVRGGK